MFIQIYFIYMTTQVIFKIDPVLKKRAQNKAKAEGTTYSDVLQSATRSYLDGVYKMGAFVPVGWEEIPMTKREKLELKKARESFKKGDYRLWSDVKHELDIKHGITRR